MSWKCNHCGEEISTHSIGHAECPRELETLRERVRELESEIAGYHKVMDQLREDCKCDTCLENRAILAEERIRELEMAMPNPYTLRAIANTFIPRYPQDGLKALAEEMADRIEKVMHARPSVDGKP